MTESMEDYLEMICRMEEENPMVGVNEVARRLNVRPSSASKMIGKLRQEGLVLFERYGQITLTEKGRERGAYLLWRHDVLIQFFCRLNRSDDQLRQVELIEHFLTEESVRNLEKLITVLPEQEANI